MQCIGMYFDCRGWKHLSASLDGCECQRPQPLLLCLLAEQAGSYTIRTANQAHVAGVESEFGCERTRADRQRYGTHEEQPLGSWCCASRWFVIKKLRTGR